MNRSESFYCEAFRPRTCLSEADWRPGLAAVAFVVLMLIVAPRCFAQLETGEIVGTVIDASGALFPGAQVVVESILTGAKTTLTTGRAGTFDAPVLPPGDYTITVSAAGFKTLVAEK